MVGPGKPFSGVTKGVVSLDLIAQIAQCPLEDP